MNIDSLLWQYQSRMLDHMPYDYPGNQLDWEINVIYWIAKVRDLIKDNKASIDTIEFVTNKIDGDRSLKVKH